MIIQIASLLIGMSLLGSAAPIVRHQPQAPGFDPNDAYMMVFRHGIDLELSIAELIFRNARPTRIISSSDESSVATARRIQWRLYLATGEFVGIQIDRRLEIGPLLHGGTTLLESIYSQTTHIRAVLNEIAGNHQRPIVVGDRHTVTAAHTPDRWLVLPETPEGSFVVVRLSTDEVPILEVDERISPPRDTNRTNTHYQKTHSSTLS